MHPGERLKINLVLIIHHQVVFEVNHVLIHVTDLIHCHFMWVAFVQVYLIQIILLKFVDQHKQVMGDGYVSSAYNVC